MQSNKLFQGTVHTYDIYIKMLSITEYLHTSVKLMVMEHAFLLPSLLTSSTKPWYLPFTCLDTMYYSRGKHLQMKLTQIILLQCSLKIGISVFFKRFFILLKLSIFLNSSFLVLLVLRHKINHIRLSLSEFHFIHTFTSVPM